MKPRFLQSIFFFLALINCNVPALKVSQGHIDLTNHNFKDIPVVKLYGDFAFYYNQFSNEIEQKYLDSPTFSKVPKSWTMQGYPAFGCGTYVLNVLLPEEKDLAIYIPDAATSYQVIWSGKVLENVGNVAKNPNDYEPSYKTKVIRLGEYKKENQLLIEVCNYTHHKAGLWEAIYLGKYENLNRRKNLKDYLYSFVTGASIIFGLYYIGLFLSKRKQSLELLFALFCLSFALHNFFFNHSLIYSIFPEIKWNIVVRANYLFSYISGIFLALFYKKLFAKIFSTFLLRLYILSFIILSFSVLTLPVYYFTQTLVLSFILNISYLLYMFMKILFFKQIKNIQYYLSLISLGFLIFTLFFDSLSLNQVFPIDSILIFGNLFFIYSHAYILSIRFNKVLLTVENLVKRLRKSNQRLLNLKSELEEIVEKRTQELIKERTRAELIGRMTTEIVHDLKNPITAIISFSGLANMDFIGRQARQEYLEMIYAESLKLSNLSQGILDYVKGGTKIQKEKVELKTYFDDINKFLNHEFKIYNIQYQFELLTESEGYFDPDLLRRVILNITSNSIDALLKDNKPIKTFSIRVTSFENNLQIEFTDNGIGISKEIQTRIFDPFFTQGKKTGTGLGMTLAKEIVELHSGTITFTSEEGKGTKFIIQLPLEQKLK